MTQTADGIKISEKAGLKNLVVYKGAKPSEYYRLMKAVNYVRGDTRSGDFYLTWLSCADFGRARFP